MSDILKRNYNFEKFKRDVVVDTDHCLKYVKRQCISSEEIAFTLHITNEVLKSWQDLKEKDILLDFSFVRILNCFLAENHAVLVKKDCKRIEEVLRKLCSRVKSNLKGKSGYNYTTFARESRSVVIRHGELLTSGDLERELYNLKAAKEALEEENRRLNDRCDQLYESLVQEEELRRKSNDSIIEARTDTEKLRRENANLLQYFDKIADQEGFINCGKTFSDLKERQQRRKIRELKTYVEQALWFAETFGLKLSSAGFKDSGGASHTIYYQTEDKRNKSYKDLSEEEKEEVKQVLYITDKFCIGEAAYHELTMTNGGEGLPRSYLVKQCKKNLNDLCHIKRTPGENEGSQLDVLSELKITIADQIDLTQFEENPHHKLRVKISGDGAKMTRITSFVIMSFSLLDCDDVMSSKGSHTIAVVKGEESYDLLRNSFADVFKAINRIIKDGKLCVNGHDIPVEFSLGGDYKFLLLLLGMKGATSDRACIWCTIHKSNRFDMSKPEQYYCQTPMSRTLPDIKKCAWKQELSCVHQPLLDIPLENVVLDELHLMLRVTDILTRNLMTAAIDWDKIDNHNKRPCDRDNLHVQALISAINSCGVCFKIWEKKDADGSGSGTYDYTSLMGTDKRLLLKNLHEKLQGVIPAEGSTSVINLWKDFNELYQMLDEKAPSNDYIASYFEKAKVWVELFTSLEGICEGYAKTNVTPYMHAMVYHVPHFMRRHCGIKRFTGQGTEKNNDDCRRIHLNKSNKWDATRDVLLVTKRIEATSEHQRTPREYTKRTIQYWENDLVEKRAKQKRQRTVDSTKRDTNNTSQINLQQMSPADFRKELKNLGVSTRVRNLKRLQEMYQDALNQPS